MIILPPDELISYISTDDDGNWIHDPNMPKDLEELFEKFVSDEKEARKTLRNERG